MIVVGYELAWNILSFNATFYSHKKSLKTHGNHNKSAEAFIVCSIYYFFLHIHYHSNGWVHNDFFKRKKYLFQKRNIKLINSDSKDIYNVREIYIFQINAFYLIFFFTLFKL